MTLDHIMIVGQGIQSLLRELAAGRTPPMVVNIADFKPREQSPGSHSKETLARFKQFLIESEDLMKTLKIVDLKSPRFNHPWFGSFSILQWQWLFAMHSGIHLKQMKEIKKSLQGDLHGVNIHKNN